MFKTNTSLKRFCKNETLKYLSTSYQKNKQCNLPITQILEKYKILFDQSNILEEIFPRQFSNEEELSSFFNLSSFSPLISAKDKITLDSINKSVNLPLWDLLDRGGKRWRPILGLMVAKYYNINIEDHYKNMTLYKIIGCIEVLHNATLMIDDVIDKSDYRRNKPCTYKLFSEGTAINAGIGLLYYPINKIMLTMNEREKYKFLVSYINEMTAINFGQTIDYEMNYSKRIINVSNYVDTVLCKTGVLPRLMVKQIFDLCVDEGEKHTKTINEILKVMDLMSIAFQIEDDILNLTENDLSKNKGMLGEDIFEGKLTLLVIRAIEKLKEADSNRLREILFMKTKDQHILSEAIELIKLGGGFEFAIEYCEKCVTEATDICLNLPIDNKTSEESIYEIIELIKYLTKRKI
jgi:geranylgeranyl pyrophosphate synthase